MSIDVPTGDLPARVAFYNDPKVRSIAYQVVLCAVIGFLVWGAASNAIENMRKAHIASGFGFWSHTAGFDISQTLIHFDSQSSSYGRAFWVGLLNTLLVASLGIVFATILGFIVGISRLSSNWLVSKVATGYVETIRNIPLLLQLLFWYNAVLKALPSFRDSIVFPGSIYLNNRGLFMPDPVFLPGFGVVEGAIIVGIIGAIAFYIWARKRQEVTGQQAPVFLVTLALVIGLPLIVFALMGFPLKFDLPVGGRFNISGGIALQPEFTALLFGLSIYTASFIAEVVRAGILAVSRGQTEAAYSVGLTPRTDFAADRHTAGHARDHPAADQPISQSDQELLAGGGDRLSRSGAGVHRHGAQPDRPGGRGGCHHHGGLSLHQPDDLAADERLQRAHRVGGTVRAPP